MAGPFDGYIMESYVVKQVFELKTHKEHWHPVAELPPKDFNLIEVQIRVTPEQIRIDKGFKEKVDSGTQCNCSTVCVPDFGPDSLVKLIEFMKNDIPFEIRNRVNIMLARASTLADVIQEGK